MEKDEVLQVLQQKLAAAKKGVDAAASQFDRLILEAPSGLPSADG